MAVLSLCTSCECMLGNSRLHGLLQSWVPHNVASIHGSHIAVPLSALLMVQGGAGKLQQVRCASAGGGVPVRRHGS